MIKIVRRKRGGGLSRTNDKQHKQNHRAQGKEQGGKARDGEVGRLKKTFTSTRAQERSQNEHRRKSLESGDERRRQELRDQRIGCRIITRRMCASVYASKGGRNEDDTRHDRGATLPRDQQDDEESKKWIQEWRGRFERDMYVWLSNHTHHRVDVVTRESRHLRNTNGEPRRPIIDCFTGEHAVLTGWRSMVEQFFNRFFFSFFILFSVVAFRWETIRTRRLGDHCLNDGVCMCLDRNKMIGRSRAKAISIWQRNNKDNHAEERQRKECWGTSYNTHKTYSSGRKEGLASNENQ